MWNGSFLFFSMLSVTQPGWDDASAVVFGNGSVCFLLHNEVGMGFVCVEGQ